MIKTWPPPTYRTPTKNTTAGRATWSQGSTLARVQRLHFIHVEGQRLKWPPLFSNCTLKPPVVLTRRRRGTHERAPQLWSRHKHRLPGRHLPAGALKSDMQIEKWKPNSGVFSENDREGIVLRVHFTCESVRMLKKENTKKARPQLTKRPLFTSFLSQQKVNVK